MNFKKMFVPAADGFCFWLMQEQQVRSGTCNFRCDSSNGTENPWVGKAPLIAAWRCFRHFAIFSAPQGYRRQSDRMEAAFPQCSYYGVGRDEGKGKGRHSGILSKKRILFCFILFSFFSGGLFAQQRKYSASNAHAHNDYNHPIPFYTAYNAGFGSIEADIILSDSELYVAHNKAGIKPDRTLQSLYLDPLQKAIRKHEGYVYSDSLKKLLLLIDLKTPAEPTLDALLKVLKQYEAITACPGLKIVITGNQPEVSRLTSYPLFLYFDGDVDKIYTSDALARVALFSNNFHKYGAWNGKGMLADSVRKKIEADVTKAHALDKPIRFWAAPDIENAWQQFIRLNVDYINTDKIPEITEFLRKQPSNSRRTK